MMRLEKLHRLIRDEFHALDERMDRIEMRLDALEANQRSLDENLVALKDYFDGRIDLLETRIERKFNLLEDTHEGLVRKKTI